MLTTEERVDRLEAMFGQFMAQISTAQVRLDRVIEEMKIEAEKDRQAWGERFEADKKEWNKRWGELANKLGTVVEDIVAPALPRIAKQYFGFVEIDDFMVRRHVRNKQDRSKRREFDAIVVGDDKVIINETKSRARVDYIDQFIEAINDIEDYFPEYKDKTIIPVFASLYIGQDMLSYLTKHSIYALTIGDDVMDIVNFQQVQGKTS